MKEQWESLKELDRIISKCNINEGLLVDTEDLKQCLLLLRKYLVTDLKEVKG